ARAAVGDGSDQDGLPGPEVVAGRTALSLGLKRFGQVDQVEDGGGEVADAAMRLMRDIPRHGECLEIDLGPHNGGAEIEQDPAFEVFDGGGKAQEVAVGGRSDGGAVAIGVFVDDVVTDADVNGDRDPESVASGQDAD